MAQRIRAGKTVPGQGWQRLNDRGIYIDVDTRDGRFTTTPFYVTSIGGKNGHWALVGASAVYRATSSGFRIHVMWRDAGALTPTHAKDNEWFINWIGFEGDV